MFGKKPKNGEEEESYFVNQYDKKYTPNAPISIEPFINIGSLDMEEAKLFDPAKKIVILRAPRAGNSAAMRDKIRAAAAQKGLQAYNGPETDGSDLYFTDPSGEISSQFKGDNVIKLAMIEINDIFTGAYGTYKVPRQIELFALRAGDAR